MMVRAYLRFQDSKRIITLDHQVSSRSEGTRRERRDGLGKKNVESDVLGVRRGKRLVDVAGGQGRGGGCHILHFEEEEGQERGRERERVG
jgi:hypothetical protein